MRQPSVREKSNGRGEFRCDVGAQGFDLDENCCHMPARDRSKSASLPRLAPVAPICTAPSLEHLGANFRTTLAPDREAF